MVRKLLVLTAATALVGFVGAANAGDTPDVLASVNLKPGQVLSSDSMSKVVGTAAAASSAGSTAATTGYFAEANQYNASYANQYYYYPANASANSSSYGVAY